MEQFTMEQLSYEDLISQIHFDERSPGNKVRVIERLQHRLSDSRKHTLLWSMYADANAIANANVIENAHVLLDDPNYSVDFKRGMLLNLPYTRAGKYGGLLHHIARLNDDMLELVDALPCQNDPMYTDADEVHTPLECSAPGSRMHARLLAMEDAEVIRCPSKLRLMSDMAVEELLDTAPAQVIWCAQNTTPWLQRYLHAKRRKPISARMLAYLEAMDITAFLDLFLHEGPDDCGACLRIPPLLQVWTSDEYVETIRSFLSQLKEGILLSALKGTLLLANGHPSHPRLRELLFEYLEIASADQLFNTMQHAVLPREYIWLFPLLPPSFFAIRRIGQHDDLLRRAMDFYRRVSIADELVILRALLFKIRPDIDSARETLDYRRGHCRLTNDAVYQELLAYVTNATAANNLQQ